VEIHGQSPLLSVLPMFVGRVIYLGNRVKKPRLQVVLKHMGTL